MTGNPYSVSVRTPEILDKLEQHPIWQQRAEEKARGQQDGIARRHRRGLRHQGLRHRRGLFARDGGNRSARAGSPSTAITSRWATASGRRSPTGWRLHLGGVADEVAVARSRHLRRARARHLRRSLHHGPGDAGRRAAQSALGAGDQHGHDRLDRRACRHACGGRGRARHVPLRTVAGGARTVGHRADRSDGPSNGRPRRWKDGQLIMPGLPPLALPAIAAKAHARNFVTGAMAHGFSRWAWSQATFAIGGQPWTADIDALAVRRGGGKFTRLDRTQRQISAHRQQPVRHRLHVAVRHAGPRRDRARHRRAAHRQGLQRPRMRPGAGAGGRASGKRRAASRWASAMRCSSRCRPTRAAPATGNGISGNTSSRADRTCRCTSSRSRCCRR